MFKGGLVAGRGGGHFHIGPVSYMPNLIGREERLLRNVKQLDVVKNAQGIKSYGDLFYTVKDLTE